MHPHDPRLTPIHDAGDPRIADYRGVRDAHLRLAQGGAAAETPRFIAEGEIVVRQMLAARILPLSILLTPARLGTVADVVAGLPPDVPVYCAPQEVMDGITGFHIHRGLLAVGPRPPDEGVEKLAKSRLSPLVVLEDLANHDNIGGIFRNAAALGAPSAGVVLSPRCADPLYRKALRVSVGHTLSVPFSRARRWPDDLDVLRAEGYRLLALTTDGAAEPLGEAAARLGAAKLALLVGAEGPGLSAGALDRAAERVRIPMRPGVDSLNAAVAVGVALAALCPVRG